MKKNKYFYEILNTIGLAACIVGLVLLFSQKPINYWWFVVAVTGVIICCFSNNEIYICSECGAEFESKDKIILTVGKSYYRRSLVTCPKCKKTSFCRSKSVRKGLTKK